jgi:hypothetical protein
MRQSTRHSAVTGRCRSRSWCEWHCVGHKHEGQWPGMVGKGQDEQRYAGTGYGVRWSWRVTCGGRLYASRMPTPRGRSGLFCCWCVRWLFDCNSRQSKGTTVQGCGLAHACCVQPHSPCVLEHCSLTAPCVVIQDLHESCIGYGYVHIHVWCINLACVDTMLVCHIVSLVCAVMYWSCVPCFRGA